MMTRGTKRAGEEATLDDVLLALNQMRDEFKKSNEYNEYRFASSERRMNIVEREVSKKSVIISGVPPSDEEDIVETVTEIGRVLGVTIVESDIDDYRRIGKEKERIKVTFVRTIVRRQLVKAVRARKKLTTLEIGYDGAVDIYINEELGSGALEIWKRARKLKKEKVIANCWTSEGSVLYKVGKDDKPKVCLKITDLLKLENALAPQPTQPAKATEKNKIVPQQPLPKKLK